MILKNKNSKYWSRGGEFWLVNMLPARLQVHIVLQWRIQGGGAMDARPLYAKHLQNNRLTHCSRKMASPSPGYPGFVTVSYKTPIHPESGFVIDPSISVPLTFVFGYVFQSAWKATVADRGGGGYRPQGSKFLSCYPLFRNVGQKGSTEGWCPLLREILNRPLSNDKITPTPRPTSLQWI